MLEPAPGVVEFKIGGAWLQLSEGNTNVTGWTFRNGVKDVAAGLVRLHAMGIKTADIKTILGLVSFFRFQDPDGNSLSFYQLL